MRAALANDDRGGSSEDSLCEGGEPQRSEGDGGEARGGATIVLKAKEEQKQGENPQQQARRGRGAPTPTAKTSAIEARTTFGQGGER